MAAYAVMQGEYRDGDNAWPWIALDLFLFWRVWRGGSRARSVLIFLGLLGTVIGVFSEALNTLDPGAGAGGQGWPAVLLMIAATACLLAPALDPEADPFDRHRQARNTPVDQAPARRS